MTSDERFLRLSGHDPTQPTEAQGDVLSQGTFKCDICGLDKPHFHTAEEVEIERFARPVFEKTKVPRNSFSRHGRGATVLYNDGGTESLWQHFVTGWFNAKRYYAAELAALNPTQPTEAQGDDASEDEKRLISLIADGNTAKEIADALGGVTEHEVNRRKVIVAEKLGFNYGRGMNIYLVRYAIRQGWIKA